MNKLTQPENILDELEYNTQLLPLAIGEYGRTVQNMISHLLTVEDREQRTRMAHTIVNVMGNLNSALKDHIDFKRKLWDHLFIMSDFKLDVDAPYPMPSPNEIFSKPDRLEYADKKIQYRYYGRIVENFLSKLSDIENTDAKASYLRLLGTFMKSSCKAWNDENVSNQAIVDQMNELSGNKLQWDYNGQEFTTDMARTGKSLNPLAKDNSHFKNKNKNRFKKYRK